MHDLGYMQWLLKFKCITNEGIRDSILELGCIYKQLIRLYSTLLYQHSFFITMPDWFSLKNGIKCKISSSTQTAPINSYRQQQLQVAAGSLIRSLPHSMILINSNIVAGVALSLQERMTKLKLCLPPCLRKRVT